MKTFRCDFGNGLVCECDTEDAPPEKGKPHIREMRWSKDAPLPKNIIRPYVAWMNSVNKQLADEWKIKIMHVFEIKPNQKEMEIWIYEPDKPPKCAEKVRR